MALLLVCSTTVCAAAENMPLMSGNPAGAAVAAAFYNETGYVEKTLSGSLTFEATLNNNSSANKSISAIYAVYDENGKMTSARASDNVPVSPYGSNKASVTFK